ncbi:transposase, partial [Micromonospora sp. NPDC020750]|uniref:transposase n=1 Tax=unclassified Micromonospora TaxID=2617518 RepID=UPI0037BC8373
WQKITPALREIYTAPTVAAAEARFEAFAAEFGDQYPAVIRLWRTSWPQFVPFLDYDHEVRKVLYTTNIIESLNARFRQAARRRGHFPTEQAAMKVLYLVVQQKRKGGGSITGRVYGWAKALNALILAYGDGSPSNNLDHTHRSNTEIATLPPAESAAQVRMLGRLTPQVRSMNSPARRPLAFTAVPFGTAASAADASSCSCAAVPAS